MSIVLRIAAFLIEKLDPKGRALDDRDYEYFPAVATAKPGANDSGFFEETERMRREI